MRRSSLIERAEDLVDEHKTLDNMETEMAQRTQALVYRLREDKINFNEFKRIAADETLTTAIAGFMLGNKTRKLTTYNSQKPHRRFRICGNSLKELSKHGALVA